jgi:hypothetical protein
MLTPSELGAWARAKADDAYKGVRDELAQLWRESDERFEQDAAERAGLPWMRRRRNPLSTIVSCTGCTRTDLVLAHNAAGASVVLEPEADGPIVVQANGLARRASDVATVPGLKGNEPRAPRGTHKLHTHRA